jgi:hypothetical protein
MSGLSNHTSQPEAFFSWLSAASGKSILRIPGKGCFPWLSWLLLPHDAECSAQPEWQGPNVGYLWRMSHSISLELRFLLFALRALSASPNRLSTSSKRNAHFHCF